MGKASSLFDNLEAEMPLSKAMCGELYPEDGEDL